MDGLLFKALRDQEQKIITGLPCPVTVPARLPRLSKGQIRRLWYWLTRLFVGVKRWSG